MNPNAKQPNQPRGENSGTPFFIFLCLLICFVCVLSVVLLSRISADPGTQSRPEKPTGSSTTEDPGPQQKPDVPVFAPGSATAVTVAANGETQTVTTEIDSPYGVLIDAATGTILAGKDADEFFDPGSMTKVMTLIVLCERLNESDLDEYVELTQEIYDYVHPTASDNGYKGSECWGSVGEVGDKMPLRGALYGIGVKSAADCAVMAMSYLFEDAEDLADAEEQFVEWMNEKVTALGLSSTQFDNIIGYESDENYTTASEMASILAYAIQCPLIREILSTSKYDCMAQGYNSKGEWVEYRTTFYSTLFNANGTANRFVAYKNKYEKDFALASKNLSFKGGKTGTIGVKPNYIYSLASFVTHKKASATYIAVTGAVSDGAAVLHDAKYLYDTFCS